MNNKILSEEINIITRKVPDNWIKDLIIMILLNIISFNRIITANYSFADDMSRINDGYMNWYLDNRYFNDILSIVLSGNSHLVDLSPVFQFLAIIVLSIAEVVLLHVFCDTKKYKLVPYFAVLPLSVCPYYLVCVTYKFDSLFMAISVLASVIPLLGINLSRRKYIGLSVVCLFIMCMTYQSSSGIYPALISFTCFIFLQDGTWQMRKVLITALDSIVAYVFSLVIYRLFFVRYEHTYAKMSIYGIRNIFKGSIYNVVQYYSQVWKDFAKSWIILIFIIAIIFILLSLVTSKINKMMTFAFLAISLLISVVVADGVYIIFAELPKNPRFMYGIGILITTLSIGIIRYRSKVGGMCVMLLTAYLIIFSCVYGNAIHYQLDYIDYRSEMVMSDLNKLYDSQSDDKPIYYSFTGNTGYAPVLRKQLKVYPILKRMGLLTITNDFWGGYYFYSHYGSDNLLYDPYVSLTEDDMELITDTMLHTIYFDGERYLIKMKKQKSTSDEGLIHNPIVKLW